MRGLYVDTGVWLALLDAADPLHPKAKAIVEAHKSVRRRASRRFLRWLGPQHFALASNLVRVELWNTRDPELRSQALRKYEGERRRVVTSTPRVVDMAWELIAAGCVTENHLADAFHIAYSIVGRAEALVTWDVGDLARPHTRRVVEEYCWRRAIPALRIGTPIEVGRWLDVKIE